MQHIDFIHTLCQCSFLYLIPEPNAFDADRIEWQGRHWQQSKHKINMGHPRKKLLAESWGSSRFFINVMSVKFTCCMFLQRKLNKTLICRVNFFFGWIQIFFPHTDGTFLTNGRMFVFGTSVDLFSGNIWNLVCHLFM